VSLGKQFQILTTRSVEIEDLTVHAQLPSFWSRWRHLATCKWWTSSKSNVIVKFQISQRIDHLTKSQVF